PDRGLPDRRTVAIRRIAFVPEAVRTGGRRPLHLLPESAAHAIARARLHRFHDRENPRAGPAKPGRFRAADGQAGARTESAVGCATRRRLMAFSRASLLHEKFP